MKKQFKIILSVTNELDMVVMNHNFIVIPGDGLLFPLDIGQSDIVLMYVFHVSQAKFSSFYQIS